MIYIPHDCGIFKGLFTYNIVFILSPKNPDPEKLSAYECGFEPFQDSRMEFDVRFYLVLGFTSMMIFLFILTIGFIYEWKKGALDWE